MLNELYTAKNGTLHVVKVVNVVREITKGEKIENTAITQQVLAQRQKFYTFGKETLNEDDLNFEPFSMELELFLEDYEKFVEDESKKYYMLDVEVGKKQPKIGIASWLESNGGAISILGAVDKGNTTLKDCILSDEVPDNMKTNIKMRVTPEQSAKVQEIVLKNEGEWSAGRRYISFTNASFLYLSKTKKLMFGTDEANFYEDNWTEVDPELFIRTNGTCEEDYLCGAEELKTIKQVLQDMEAPLKDFDPINPTHYQIGGIETINYLEAKLTPEEFKGYCKGNSIKYLSRAGHKGEEIDDYKKAAWYLDKLINK